MVPSSLARYWRSIGALPCKVACSRSLGCVNFLDDQPVRCLPGEHGDEKGVMLSSRARLSQGSISAWLCDTCRTPTWYYQVDHQPRVCSFISLWNRCATSRDPLLQAPGYSLRGQRLRVTMAPKEALLALCLSLGQAFGFMGGPSLSLGRGPPLARGPRPRALTRQYAAADLTSIEEMSAVAGSKLPDLSQSAFPDIPEEPYDLIVLGSGPAGETAAGEWMC
jgi:hypothetical protein